MTSSYMLMQSANPGHEIERQPGQFDPLPIVSSVNSKYRFSVLHLSLRYLTMKHKLLQGNRSLAVLCGCGNENFLLKGCGKYFSTRKCTKKWGGCDLSGVTYEKLALFMTVSTKCLLVFRQTSCYKCYSSVCKTGLTRDVFSSCTCKV
jgi:hypothetical protein